MADLQTGSYQMPLDTHATPRGARRLSFPTQSILALALLGLIAVMPSCARDTQEASGPAEGKAAEKLAAPASPPAPSAAMAYDAARMGGLVASAAMPEEALDREEYPHADPNPVKVAAEEPVSTFSVDVDTASYAVMRRFLNDGRLPPSDAVRVEELVNYFDYDYPAAESLEAPFRVTTRLYPAPWKAGAEILQIGIKGYEVTAKDVPPLNLVLLLDTSGSMDSPDKLPLLKKALRLFVEELSPRDRIAIVTYAGSAGTVLEPTSGKDKARILAALDRLDAGGSTAGAEGIRQAYALAKASFDKAAVNRVILATDGDFNVGIADPNQLEDFVARERESGVFLTVLGFGRGNYSDVRMQKLAQAGNGNAAYIDTLNEARKVLVEEMRSTLIPIAKDVKIQVEFNPALVAEYRLVGYETRKLERADFANDKVDAGDIGSGHTVTALYEIVRVGSPARATEDLRYGTRAPKDAKPGELAFVKVRWKKPDGDKSALIETPVPAGSALASLEAAGEDARFAAAVAAFGQWLRRDAAVGTATPADIARLASGARGADPFGIRAEFVQLVRLAASLPALPALEGGGGAIPQ
ncbi:MAG: VWA domain-containing protein [Alphaproteobacteria bacterium]|nr:VWA domain-containing protein [Alphaproteobacteria bacterium]